MKRLFHFNLKHILILLLIILPCSRLFSNKIAVSIAPGGVNQANQTITFDLSWQNNWRVDGTPYTSNNWDAAWVFVKFRDCSASNNVQFTHGLISTILGDHNFNVLSSSTPFEPTLANGSSVAIDPAPNNTGVMLRSANFPVSSPQTIAARVTLKVTNMPISSSTQGLDVRINAIEMVFVPIGAYSLGDGNTSNKSYGSFATSTGSNQAITISSEGAQTIYEVSGGGSICPSQACALTANFPKGYDPFYIMKYEITQGQYVDFLNASSAIGQSMHFTSSVSGNRYNITQNSTTLVFSTSRPNRACNFLSWADVGSYLDWAALRPLTELEYEKACKGTAPVSPYDYAMGVAFATRAVDIAGPENGTETISVPGNSNICAAGSIAFGGSGDGGQGPLRGGIFATGSTASRNQTGASFYGAFELSGNVDEYYVSALAGTGIDYIVQGDGILDDATGQFNNYGWPSPLLSGNTIIHRGGNWTTGTVVGGSIVGDGTSASFLNVSNRGGGTLTTRINTSGGRGGRSVTGTPTTPTNPTTLTYTGTQQTFVVPNGVTALTIDVYGAQGGGASSGGGGGGRAKGTLAVAPGQIFYVYVGQKPAAQTGGFNGGGNSQYVTGGGGGASDVRFGGIAAANRIIIGGGGGGRGDAGSAGGAGGSVAASFNSPNWCAAGGFGAGTTTNGSNGSSSGSGGNGGATATSGGGGGGYTSGGTGGVGGGNNSTTPGTGGISIIGTGGRGGWHTSCTSNYGGGGGGGYYGGGGGSGCGSCCGTGASGGGGSSAIITSGYGWSNVLFQGGVQSGNGQVIFSW